MYSEPQAQPRVRLPSRVPLDPNTVWHCAFHWNGLVVYYEGAESEAYAASCSMHATPRVVFEHFIRLDNGDSAWDLFDDVEVLDPVPENDHKLVRATPRHLPAASAAQPLNGVGSRGG